MQQGAALSFEYRSLVQHFLLKLSLQNLGVIDGCHQASPAWRAKQKKSSHGYRRCSARSMEEAAASAL